jgi:hypothetical protein
MLIKRLTWEVWEDIEDEVKQHEIVDPSWEAIREAFSHLDSQARPAFSLSLHDQKPYLPSLTVIGGPDEYAVALERVPSSSYGECERIQLINPARFQRFGTSSYRGIGKGDHNYEIETMLLTPDATMILTIIQHFATTGQWYPSAPFIVEAEDEEGEWRQYTD